MRNLHTPLVLLTTLCVAPSCAPADVDLSEPQGGVVSQAVVYGEDDRREVYRYDGNTFARASQSLVALIPPSLIVSTPGGGKAPSPESARDLLQLCSDEPFVDQPAVASCSGVLIDEDLVLTAGHCFEDGDACDTYAYVFDYQYSRPGQNQQITDLDVYGCKSLLVRGHQRLAGGGIHDFAVVQLDRKVDLRRRPAPLRIDRVGLEEAITVMGSPQGMPNKIDTGGSVQASPKAALDYWFADTDTFGGSSGSPAFDAELKLVGILIRGNADYVADPQLACLRAKRIEDEDESEGSFEQFASLTPALSALCSTDEGQSRPVCAPPPPVRGEVRLECSAVVGASHTRATLPSLLLALTVFIERYRRRKAPHRS